MMLTISFVVWQRNDSYCCGLLCCQPLLLEVWQRSGSCCWCWLCCRPLLFEVWQSSGSCCWSWLNCCPLVFFGGFTEEWFVLLWLVILLHINVYLYFPIIIPKQFLSPTPICFEQIVFTSDITLNYLAFPSFDFEPTWWRVFQRRPVCTKLDIYVFTTRCTSLILWNWIDITMTA